MPCGKFVGIDGCRAGWIAVIVTADGLSETKIYETIRECWEELREADLLLIDMLIGLPSHSTPVRLCDVEARKLLSPTRASSIFPAPIRDLLAVREYAEANALSKELVSRGLSKQTWNLVPKIRELDLLLQSDKTARQKLRESHPELCFTSLNGGTPMMHNKKTQAGYEQRVQLLTELYPEADRLVNQTLSRYQRKAVVRDDIVDALVLAVSALLGNKEGKELGVVPINKQWDATGLPMQICFSTIYP